jgi:hypothetical protein
MLTLQLTPVCPGTFTVKATVRASDFDPAAKDNVVIASTTVESNGQPLSEVCFIFNDQFE